jgi:hypothetical protein
MEEEERPAISGLSGNDCCWRLKDGACIRER